MAKAVSMAAPFELGYAHFWVSMAAPFQWLRRLSGIICFLSR